MAIVIQKKTDEHEEALKKIQGLVTDLEAKEAKMDDVKADLAKQREKADILQGQGQNLESKIADLEMSLEVLKTKCQADIQSAQEASKDDLNIMKAEHEITIRDLKMQLEISNAQKVEFEETIEQLKQDIKDLNEERKIGDKKGQALIKDLKKQLLSEQQRNDKLSDKMKELQFSSEPASTLSSGDNFTETDRTSNSSWSIYSEKNNDHSPSPTPQDQTDSSSNAVEDEKSKRITWLTDEKSLLEQRLQMLENSAAAMADDLVKKSNIIQFYCMEGKQDHVKKEASASSTPSEKMRSVKKRLDLLVNPDQVEAQQKEELQRMQRMLEETLTKNMHLQQDLEHLSQEVVRLSKLVPM